MSFAFQFVVHHHSLWQDSLNVAVDVAVAVVVVRGIYCCFDELRLQTVPLPY